LANSQQTSLLKLAQEGISVYSPHTAVDAAPGGLNDWLADIVTGVNTEKNSRSDPYVPNFPPSNDYFPLLQVKKVANPATEG
jgi:putative NIF3 family GTP cyclohydrolase 1 type 2